MLQLPIASDPEKGADNHTYLNPMILSNVECPDHADTEGDDGDDDDNRISEP